MRWATLGMASALSLAALELAAGPLVRFSEDELKGETAEAVQANKQLQELENKIESNEIPPVEFSFDKYVLRPRSKTALKYIADLMFQHPTLKLIVYGHTCDIGSIRYNQWLSQKRAEAVRNYLLQLGISSESIKAKGFGKSRPLYKNADGEASRSKNRRVEFVFTSRDYESVY